MSYVTMESRSSTDLTRPVRMLGNFAKQAAADHARLDLRQLAVADAIAEQRVRGLVAEAPLEGGDETLAALSATAPAKLTRSWSCTSPLLIASPATPDVRKQADGKGVSSPRRRQSGREDEARDRCSEYRSR